MSVQNISGSTRLLIGTQGFDKPTAKGQLEGIATYKQGSVKGALKKAMGQTVDIMVNGQLHTVNKRSLNKWLARTTQGSEIKTLGTFAKAHKVIGQAIKDSSSGQLGTILTNHAKAQSIGGVEKTHFATVQGTKDLFTREFTVLETKRTTVTEAANKRAFATKFVRAIQSAAAQVKAATATTIASLTASQANHKPVKHDPATVLAAKAEQAAAKKLARETRTAEVTARREARLANLQIVPVGEVRDMSLQAYVNEKRAEEAAAQLVTPEEVAHVEQPGFMSRVSSGIRSTATRAFTATATKAQTLGSRALLATGLRNPTAEEATIASLTANAKAHKPSINKASLASVTAQRTEQAAAKKLARETHAAEVKARREARPALLKDVTASARNTKDAIAVLEADLEAVGTVKRQFLHSKGKYHAATTIQTAVRGMLARNKVNTLKEAKLQREVTAFVADLTDRVVEDVEKLKATESKALRALLPTVVEQPAQRSLAGRVLGLVGW